MTIKEPGLFRLRMIGAALLGAVAAFGLAPYGLWPATLVALLLLPLVALNGVGAARAGWVGWAFGLGYFAHALHWIIEPFLIEPERHGWMAPFALVGLAGGLALFWWPAFWLAASVSRHVIARAWGLVFFLGLAEFARAYLLTGFPWGAISQIWLDTPLAQMLADMGPHGLGLLTLAAILPLGAALCARNWPRTVVNGGGMALLAALALLRDDPPTAPLTGKTIRLVQPNAPQAQKWDPQRFPIFLERQISFTAAGPRPDLVVWPETAVPYWLDQATPVLARITAAADGAPVVLGIRRFEDGRIYNSAIHVDGQGAVSGIYDKYHLVPFGEYVPFGNLMAGFGIHGFASNAGQGFSPGRGPLLLTLGDLGRALPLICYEAVFPQDVLAAPERPDFLLQLTNDAWFGDWSGPYQHLAQARMRAIEQGLPMIRSANTGVSAMIDPWGRITSEIPLGEAGYVDAVLPAPAKPTPYARWGEWPVFLFALAGAAIVAGLQRRKTS